VIDDKNRWDFKLKTLIDEIIKNNSVNKFKKFGQDYLLNCLI
jgi:hypothetical protein